MKILHLDTNHPLLIQQLDDLGFINDEDYTSSKEEVEAIQKTSSKLSKILKDKLVKLQPALKNAFINSSGVSQAFYGEFHVTLKKESGQWKIVVDSDTNKEGTITEAMFQAAKPLE